MVLVLQEDLHLIDRVAARHPELKLTIDHLALARGKDEVAFAQFYKLLPPAKRPNIAVKVTCLPHYTNDTYPSAGCIPACSSSPQHSVRGACSGVRTGRACRARCASA
jgi:hypothetical protein